MFRTFAKRGFSSLLVSQTSAVKQRHRAIAFQYRRLQSMTSKPLPQTHSALPQAVEGNSRDNAKSDLLRARNVYITNPSPDSVKISEEHHVHEHYHAPGSQQNNQQQLMELKKAVDELCAKYDKFYAREELKAENPGAQGPTSMEVMKAIEKVGKEVNFLQIDIWDFREERLRNLSTKAHVKDTAAAAEGNLASQISELESLVRNKFVSVDTQLTLSQQRAERVIKVSNEVGKQLEVLQNEMAKLAAQCIQALQRDGSKNVETRWKSLIKTLKSLKGSRSIMEWIVDIYLRGIFLTIMIGTVVLIYKLLTLDSQGVSRFT